MALILIFTLAEETYGLEIEAIQEVVEKPALHFVPRADGALLGAINFHGQILSLVDLPRLLGFDSEQLDHRRVVLTAEYQSLALAVTLVQRIVKLDLAALQSNLTGESKNAARGVVDMDGTLVNLLDLDEILKQLRKLYQ